MDGHKGADKTRMGCQPSLNLLASTDASEISHEEHALSPGWDLPVELGKEA